MAPSTRLVKSSESMSREELAGLLEGLAGRIRNGTVTLKSGADEVQLELPERVKVDVEVTEAVRRRGTKMELEIEIEWYPGQDSGRGGIELG